MSRNSSGGALIFDYHPLERDIIKSAQLDQYTKRWSALPVLDVP